jgi:hypothetical protein
MAMRITAAVALMAICIQGSTSVAQTPTPTFKGGVELVRTDAIVRDARGQFIADLKAGEFEVYEDGVKQEIVAPTMIHGGREFNADLVLELAELTRAANRANATIYAIDPRGLAAGPDIDADVRVPEWNAYVRRSQDSLRVMAEETGGFAVVNMNDFSAGLKRIDAETTDYYVLAYSSSNEDQLKRVRRIEVRTTRPGATVFHRTSYTRAPAR